MKSLKLRTEGTAVGAAVGDVEIEAVADHVGNACALVNITDAEQSPSVEAGDAGDILKRQSFDFGKFLGGRPYIGRFTTLAPPVLR